MDDLLVVGIVILLSSTGGFGLAALIIKTLRAVRANKDRIQELKDRVTEVGILAAEGTERLHERLDRVNERLDRIETATRSRARTTAPIDALERLRSQLNQRLSDSAVRRESEPRTRHERLTAEGDLGL